VRAVAFDPIDHILSLDLGSRGIAKIFTPGAAFAAAGALVRARRVLITTGFSLGPDLPETDGPPGAAVLGRALRRLGAEVRYVTDAITLPVLQAALKTLEEPADVGVYPGGEHAALTVLAAHRPTHLIAIERPGRSRSGDYLSARGESVRAWNAPLDELFVRVNAMKKAKALSGLASARRALRQPTLGGSCLAVPATTGIGDGGNEIGMGNVRARLARQGSLVARIASVVRVDHLVVAGTSNWGAYGVVAALERLTERSLLHTPALERRLVEACVAAGAADGITRRREPTVDGLPVDAHASVVGLLALAASAGRRGIMGRIDRRERGHR
jgi:hypothetical protein